MSAVFSQIINYALLAFGFGFVIFFHELGHFLAAKYCGVKVEQFAVGFGPAIFSWRKGLGFRWRTSGKELEDLRQRDQEGVEKTDLSRISDTEYRLNWIPLGGYVKMLGQDDMRPGATAEDPAAYNKKPIRSRMLIVSAGVIMNVILAAIGFMVVFLRGWPLPAARVGPLISEAPALKAVDAKGNPAPLQPGDSIIEYDGKKTRDDFTALILASALTQEGKPVPLLIQRLGHTDYETVYITPARKDNDPKSFLAIGMEQPFLLEGPDPKTNKKELDDKTAIELGGQDALVLTPGDVVTQINGKDVQSDQYWVLLSALDHSDGKKIDLTIKSADGAIVHREAHPHFLESFTDHEEQNLLGIIPRATVVRLMESSLARGRLKPGDVILSLSDPSTGNDFRPNPSAQEIIDNIDRAGNSDDAVTMTVLSEGDAKPHDVTNLKPHLMNYNWFKRLLGIAPGKHVLGFTPGLDEEHTVVADIRKNSLLDGKLRKGDTVTAINGQAVSNWFEVIHAIARATPGADFTITFNRVDQAKPQTVTVQPNAEQIDAAKMVMIYTPEIEYRPMTSTRQTKNPVVAIGWGILETRDLILQFYLTLQRMVTGGIAVGNMMGPVGIFSAGAAFAEKGITWLIWFLAMISANLAVVNFLPIPIVDGGLFTFLILEKIQGRPLSANTQKIVQMVGLALILGVFLLVTYQDIARIATN